MRTPVAWVLALPLLLLVGCSPVGPKYKRPTVQTPAIYKELPTGANDEWKTAQPSDSELRGNWWELFNDPKLNQLEPLVSLSNETVRQTEARFRQARAFVAFNRANYYPTVTIGTSGSVTYTSRSTPGFTTGGSTNVRNANANPFLEYSFPLGISWEPNLWGRVTLAVQSAVSNAQSVAADLENVRLSLQAELAADYFLMHGIDMQASLLARTIAAYERALQLTINRYNGGVSSKADVLQAQTQLETTRAAMTDLGVQRAAYEHAIAVLSGQPPASLSLPAQDIVGETTASSRRSPFTAARTSAGYRQCGETGRISQRTDRIGAGCLFPFPDTERQRRIPEWLFECVHCRTDTRLVAGAVHLTYTARFRPPTGGTAPNRGSV